MGGKKKNLANRLAKMSEEERQRYLQHKADQEKELQRRKEQLISTFLKNKIRHEDAFARLNVAKLNENWHQLLRKIKCSEMKKEVTYMKEHADRVLEFKNRTISKLLTELQEAEEQYSINFQSHLNHINKIIDFGKQVLDDMHEEYDKEIEKRIKEASVERWSIFQAAHDQELHLKTVCFQFDEKSKAELRENYNYYFKISDGEMQKHAKEFKALRDEKEKHITKVWLEIGKLIKDYTEKTDARRSHLAELNALDAQNGEEIQNAEKQLMQNQLELASLERSFAKVQSASATEIERLRECVAKLKSDFCRHKTATFKKLQEDNVNIQFMSHVSNAVLQELQKQQDKGEKLLQLSSLCRKFETEEEAATRFIDISRLSGEQLHFVEELASPDSDGLPPIVCGEDLNVSEHWGRIQIMDNFWRYYNRTLLKVMAMKKFRVDIQQENRRLKEQIKREMEARVDTALDDRQRGNAEEAQKRLFVVCASAASSVRTH